MEGTAVDRPNLPDPIPLRALLTPETLAQWMGDDPATVAAKLKEGEEAQWETTWGKSVA